MDVSVPEDESDTSERKALTYNSNTRRRVASSHVGKGLEYSILASAHWLRQQIPAWGYKGKLQDYEDAMAMRNIIPCPTLPNRAAEEIPEEIAVPPSVLLPFKSGRI